MKQWIKLFESHGRQVAVELKDEDGTVSVNFRWKEDDFGVDVGPSFNTGDDDRDYELQEKFFEKVDQDVTDKMVAGIIEQLQLQGDDA